MCITPRGLGLQRLRACATRLGATRLGAALAGAAALLACQKAPPPPAESSRAPAVPPASQPSPPVVAPAPSPPAVAPAPSPPAAPAPATGANLGALEPLICFGNEPFWAVQFRADGSATCEASCEPPPGLRVGNLSLTPSGDPRGFDLLDAGGGVFLRAALQKTGKCSDGMSDNLHPYVVKAVGKVGPYEGCCRDKRIKLPSG